MRILTGPEIFNNNLHGSVITIGNFDGVHRGHLEIFRRLRLEGERLGLPTVAVTFEPHPLAVLSPENAPPLITTFDQKAGLIAEAGIDCLVVIEFTREFSQIAADTFVRDILCGSLGMRHIIIGHDYAFGRDRQGNYETLERLGAECGFTLEDLDPVRENDVVFSSSLARRLIRSGDMPGAAAILGRYHVISGRVVHGREMGKKLGYPTANIATPNELLPPDGVYATMVSVDDTLVQGACNIGTNPTFGENERTVEVFLLDFDGQLYDREIALCFVQRLREEKRFSGIDELIRAIERDVAATGQILAAVDRTMVRPLLGVVPEDTP
jgi:riboflavin kinase / FMN adenylyltransferase